MSIQSDEPLVASGIRRLSCMSTLTQHNAKPVLAQVLNLEDFTWSRIEQIGPAPASKEEDAPLLAAPPLPPLAGHSLVSCVSSLSLPVSSLDNCTSRSSSQIAPDIQCLAFVICAWYITWEDHRGPCGPAIHITSTSPGLGSHLCNG